MKGSSVGRGLVERCSLNMPRLVLYGHLPPPYTGQSISFANLVDALRADRDGWRLHVVNVGAEDWRPARVNFAPTIKMLRQMLHVLLWLRQSDLLYLTISQSKLGFLRDACLVWAARGMRKQIVARLDGGAFHRLYEESLWPFRWLLEGTANQITVFQVLSESIRRSCQVIPGLQDRLQVLGNGVEGPTAVLSKELPKEGPIRVLFLSNLLFEKGYTDLLEATAVLRRMCPNLRLHLEITGAFMAQHPYFSSAAAARNDFWRRVKKHGLEEVITYHGVVTGERKEKLLRESHLFVLPTYYRYEGQPISVMEAMSYGFPVIVTAWSALPEMVADSENGFVIPPRDSAALAAAIARTVSSPVTYARLAQGAREKFRREFTFEVHIARMKESFEAALAVKG